MIPKVNFSGYLQLPVLFSLDDMKQALELIQPFSFFNVSAVQKSDSLEVTMEGFLDFYKNYLDNLFHEPESSYEKINQYFSMAMASDASCFFRQDFSGDRFLLKPKRSVLQLQPLGLFVSSIDSEIHIKTFAKDVQSFGIKINFPTIYEDSALHQVFELSPQDEEYKKFIALRTFVRKKTSPLIIEKEGQRHVTQIRVSHQLKHLVSSLTFFEQHRLKVQI